jgi:hypothetical protein
LKVSMTFDEIVALYQLDEDGKKALLSWKEHLDDTFNGALVSLCGEYSVEPQFVLLIIELNKLDKKLGEMVKLLEDDKDDWKKQ